MPVVASISVAVLPCPQRGDFPHLGSQVDVDGRRRRFHRLVQAPGRLALGCRPKFRVLGPQFRHRGRANAKHLGDLAYRLARGYEPGCLADLLDGGHGRPGGNPLDRPLRSCLRRVQEDGGSLPAGRALVPPQPLCRQAFFGRDGAMFSRFVRVGGRPGTGPDWPMVGGATPLLWVLPSCCRPSCVDCGFRGEHFHDARCQVVRARFRVPVKRYHVAGNVYAEAEGRQVTCRPSSSAPLPALLEGQLANDLSPRAGHVRRVDGAGNVVDDPQGKCRLLLRLSGGLGGRVKLVARFRQGKQRPGDDRPTGGRVCRHGPAVGWAVQFFQGPLGAVAEVPIEDPPPPKGSDAA